MPAGYCPFVRPYGSVEKGLGYDGVEEVNGWIEVVMKNDACKIDSTCRLLEEAKKRTLSCPGH